MKFYTLTTELTDKAALEADYAAAREIGVLKVGESCLFIRRKLKNYYIPYGDIRRCFRRVLLVPAKLCCGKGDLPVENLVICGDAGEIAQVQLPGTKAAKVLIDVLKEKLPEVDFSLPAKSEEKQED